MGCRMCVFDVGGVGTASQVANSVADGWAQDFMPLATSDYTLGTTDVIKLDGTSSTQTITTTSATTPGSYGFGNALPNVTSMVIAWQTGVRGRSHRGRSYLFSPTTNQVTQPQTSDLTGAAITALTTAGNNFLVRIASNHPIALNLAVLSRTLGVATAVTNARGDPIAHVQRRRYEPVARH